MNYRMAALIAALALTGCAGGSPFESPVIADAKRQVTEQLVDSESARFEDVVAQKTTMDTPTTVRPIQPGEEAVCGWVNAKNRMGGYVGNERFLVKAGFTTFVGGDEPAWEGEFATCVLRSENDKARDRFSREADRELIAYNDAIKAN